VGKAIRVASIVLMAIVIAACDGAAPTVSGDPTAAIQIYSQKTVGLEDLLTRQIAEFQTLHRSITVKAVHYDNDQLRAQFQNAALTEGGPELVYGSNENLGPWVRSKVIQPVDTLMGASFFQQFADNAVGSVTYKGHVYAAPDINGNHLMLLYNKEIATDSALSQATGFIWPPNNTDDLVKSIDRFTDPSQNQYGLVFAEDDPLWLTPWIAGFGGSVLDSTSKPTLSTQPVIDALGFERSLKMHAAIPRTVNYDDADQMFRAGRVAFIIDGDWSLKRYSDRLGANLGIARLPLVRKSGKWAAPYTSALGYSVNAHASGDKLKAAKLFLQYISEASQNVKVAALGAIPANKAAIKDPLVANDPILGASSAALVHGIARPIVPEMGAILDAMRGPIADVMNNNEDAASAASAMQADAERRISALNL
jgi:arabinogalactan oligomer/maltooligosaccharide transport system substrate-binding protein